MISILHGEDIASSDIRLKSILKSYSTHTKLWYQQKSDGLKFVEETNQSNLFSEEKLFICQNFISQKVITPKHLAKINPDLSIIFWEHKTISSNDLSKLPKMVKVEHFKERQAIFSFLDSISPNLTKTLIFLGKLEDGENLIWNLSQRLMILFLQKLEFDKSQIESLTKRKMQTWQWEKIVNQAKLFSKESLAGLYFGVLKIDFLIKSGKSNLPAKNLVEMLLIKYLRTS